MQTPLPLLTIALLGLAAAAPAQDATPAAKSPDAPAEASSPAATSAPKATPTVIRIVRPARHVVFPERTPKPQVTEEERPRSFWERLFGRRRRPEPATEAPATPTATPKATPRPKKVKPAGPPAAETDAGPAATPAPKSAKVKTPPVEKSGDAATTEKPAVANADTTAPVKATPKPSVAASVPKTTPAPTATPASKTRGKGKDAAPAPTLSATPARKAPVAPSADADADAQDKYKFEVAKNKALEDPEVRKLKDKADGATSDDEARKAQRAYNKALFNKMRSIDSSIKDRADRIEASIMKRLDTAE